MQHVVQPVTAHGIRTSSQLVNALHVVEKDGHEPYVVLLDVAKVFPSTLHVAIFELVQHARYPANYVTAIKKGYQHTGTYCDVKGQHIHYKPTRGVKEGCPCSPLLFSIIYEVLLKQWVAKYPNAFVCVDDIAIIVKSQEELERLFADLSVWGSHIGIRFSPKRLRCSTFTDPILPSHVFRNTCGGETAVYRYATLSSPTWGTLLAAPDTRERHETPSLHPFKPK